MNMKKCEECGKTLGLSNSYRHPTMGRNHLICSQCFNQVSESLEKWRNTVLPYRNFFNNCSPNNSFQSNWKNRLTDYIKTKNTIHNTGPRDSCMTNEIRTLM